MSIETTLTLVVAACILLGAVVLRAAVYGGIRLFVIVREWVRPAPARHRARTARVAAVAASFTRSPTQH